MKKHTLPSLIHSNYKKIILILVVILFIGILTLGGADKKNSKADASTINRKYFTCVHIRPDDTLWSIANEYISEEYESVDAYIKEVKSINNMKNDIIYAGASLIVPYYAAPN